MGKASSEESITDAELAEIEDVAKNLPTKGVSHDTSDLFLLEKLIELQPDLVPREPDFFDAYRRHLKKEPEYSSQRKVMKELKSSKGTVFNHFKTIKEHIAAIREGTFETAAEEIPALTQERTAQILRNGKIVQLDPRVIIPPEEHNSYKRAMYFQRRRGPRAHEIKAMVPSVLEMGIIEMPTVQAPGSHNGHIHRFIDGEKRFRAWILADEQSGGTDKKPVLEYPICWVIDCTNAEGELIALEKNQNKDNFDLGDRDYSIILMYENHPQTYTQKTMSEIFSLAKQTIRNIIGAWRESWPTNEKKGETSTNNPIRQALIDRKITTYHGRQLARLKKWPSEQRRIGRWLLKEVNKYGREDALIKNEYSHGEEQGSFTFFDYDYAGVSAGQLGKMVRSVIQKMDHAEAVKKEVSKRLKDGKIDSTISENEYYRLKTEMGKKLTHHSDGITKGSMDFGLKEAGVKVSARIPEPTSKKPVSPATAESVRSEQETLTEPEPVKVCTNCQIANDPEKDDCCPLSLKPDENNECPIQFVYPGRPSRRNLRCPFCNGLAIEGLLKGLNVEVEYYKTKSGNAHKAHSLCVHDAFLKKHDLKGYCQKCLPDACDLMRAVRDGGLDVEVKFCPETGEDGIAWFIPRPDVDIKNVNKEVENRVQKLIKEATQALEKTKAAEAAGRST